jgi:hypothetical protein
VREKDVLFVFFCFCFKNRLLRSVSMVKTMLLEIPCILKHFREEKKPHGD